MSEQADRSLRGDRVYTPSWVAEDMVRWFQPTGKILEPFRGTGVFTQLIPDAFWCEIDEGRNFFSWTERVDWVISNPPYSLTRECFNHAFRICDDLVFLVPLRNVFSGYGFVRDIRRFGNIAHIRLYGTGNRLGFPMGNCVGAIHVQRGYTGPTSWSDSADGRDLSEWTWSED
jgi:hypothetical protein